MLGILFLAVFFVPQIVTDLLLFFFQDIMDVLKVIFFLSLKQIMIHQLLGILFSVPHIIIDQLISIDFSFLAGENLLEPAKNLLDTV